MSDTVQQIKDKLSILDVVSPYVELHKAGKNFKGRSPFSAEKTPSFYVSPDRGMYYCFSTSQGGDMFTFIQAMEGVDFKGALKVLADKAGVELVPEDPKKRSERERLIEAMEAATKFYEGWLPQHAPASEYLTRRGVTPQTIAKWRIGFAPGPPHYGWRDLKEALEGQGFTAEELLKAGLIKQTDGGKQPFDVFRDRVVFPMFDQGGKVVAFSGRILSTDSDAPKYVNSPETMLYKKSELLFGYDKAKAGIRTLGFSLIVEGQFDVVMCHQAGYNNTVAVSGTALTLHHVQQLERLSDKVVLALDADRAGIAAMKKAADVMLRRGLDVKVAELPEGKDPADIIADGGSQFKQVIGKSVHVIEFLLHVLRREIADDRSFKLKTREEILPFVLLLPSRIDQEHFVDIIAKTIETAPDAVRYEIERLRDQHENERKPVEQNDVSTTIKAATRSSEVYERAYMFLRGALPILPATEAAQVEAILKETEEIAEPPEIVESELAGVGFMLEQQFADSPALARQEEVVTKLNHYRMGLIRSQLSRSRTALIEAEASSDEIKFTELLTRIGELERLLRQETYTAEQLFAQND